MLVSATTRIGQALCFAGSLDLGLQLGLRQSGRSKPGQAVSRLEQTVYSASPKLALEQRS